MALKLHTTYPGRFDSPSENYPQGKWRNRSNSTAHDGGYLEEKHMNDIYGFFGALLRNAEMSPNGEVDTAKKSQFYDALVEVAKKAVGAGISLQDTDGTVRGQIVATDQGLQLTQYPRDGGLQTITFPTSGDGGEIVLKQDLANPDMGAAMVARGVVAVDSIADLIALPEGQRKEGLRYLVKGYHAGSDVGGGVFYWDESRSGENDSGYVFNGWVRITDNDIVFLENFGFIFDTNNDQSTPIQNALNYAEGKGLVVTPTKTGEFLLENYVLVKEHTTLDLKGSRVHTVDRHTGGYGHWPVAIFGGTDMEVPKEERVPKYKNISIRNVRMEWDELDGSLDSRDGEDTSKWDNKSLSRPIMMLQVDGGEVSGCTIRNGANWGIGLGASRGIKVFKNRLENFQWHGVATTQDHGLFGDCHIYDNDIANTINGYACDVHTVAGEKTEIYLNRFKNVSQIAKSQLGGYIIIRSNTGTVMNRGNPQLFAIIGPNYGFEFSHNNIEVTLGAGVQGGETYIAGCGTDDKTFVISGNTVTGHLASVAQIQSFGITRIENNYIETRDTLGRVFAADRTQSDPGIRDAKLHISNNSIISKQFGNTDDVLFMVARYFGEVIVSDNSFYYEINPEISTHYGAIAFSNETIVFTNNRISCGNGSGDRCLSLTSNEFVLSTGNSGKGVQRYLRNSEVYHYRNFFTSTSEDSQEPYTGS